MTQFFPTRAFLSMMAFSMTQFSPIPTGTPPAARTAARFSRQTIRADDHRPLIVHPRLTRERKPTMDSCTVQSARSAPWEMMESLM